MQLHFTKMHGAGNDFVVIDAVSQAVSLTPQQIRQLADRHYGVGCDQVLIIEPPASDAVDFRYRIYNPDGGEAEQCGNGARCFARYAHDRGLTPKTDIRVESRGGIINQRILSDGSVAVDMGTPRFEPRDIPFQADTAAPTYTLDMENGQSIELSALSMGNPHAVIEVDDVTDAPVDTLGARLSTHPRFPNGVNVGFLQIIDKGHIKLRVFERGAGETLACGSGACAAVAAGRRRAQLDSEVSVELPGGQLTVQWDGGDTPVWLTGPVTYVFEGRIEL